LLKREGRQAQPGVVRQSLAVAHFARHHLPEVEMVKQAPFAPQSASLEHGLEQYPPGVGKKPALLRSVSFQQVGVLPSAQSVLLAHAAPMGPAVRRSGIAERSSMPRSFGVSSLVHPAKSRQIANSRIAPPVASVTD
jgi:hypothetical protein